jgi:hypothetical protein
MKNILKYSIIFLVYLILGILFWGNHDYMLPTFITLFIVINLYLLDTSKSFILNFIQLSGISILAFVISLFTEDANKFMVIQYVGAMILSSALIFYLKKNSKLSAPI